MGIQILAPGLVYALRQRRKFTRPSIGPFQWARPVALPKPEAKNTATRKFSPIIFKRLTEDRFTPRISRP